MKQTDLRKVAAAALAGTMALSCASCMLFGPNKKEIIEAADEFAGALVKQDAGKIIKLTNEKKDSDAAEALETLFGDDIYTDEQNEFNKAVADTIAYEIDEDSVEVDKEEASIDVTFTMVDYEKALKNGDYADIDEVLDALEDCDDTREVEITFEFEKDDDSWLITNLSDNAYAKLYEFYMYELDLTPDLVSLLDYTDCWPGTTGIYSDVYFTEDISDYENDILFDVYYEGSLIAADQYPSFYGSYFYCDYNDPNYDYLDAGEYTIVVKCGDTELTTMTTTVEEYMEPQPTDSIPDDIDYNYYYDAEGELGDKVVAVDWYLDNGNYVYTFNYGIEYNIYFTDDLTYDDVVGITYNIYDEDGELLAEGLTVYGSNISYGTNDQGYYYVYLPYNTGEELASGTYYIEVFNPDGTTLLTDYCIVQ